MPPNDPFYHFAWTTIAVCLPTYILIFVLNAHGTLEWWRRSVMVSYSVPARWTAHLLEKVGYIPKWAQTHLATSPPSPDTVPGQLRRPGKPRTDSTQIAMAIRNATGTAATVLSPTMSRTMSSESKGSEQMPRSHANSAPMTSLRWDFNMSNQQMSRQECPDSEAVEPSAQLRLNGTESSPVGPLQDMGRSTRSWSLRDVLAVRQGKKSGDIYRPDLV